VAAREKLDAGLVGVPRPVTRNVRTPIVGGGCGADDSIAVALAGSVISDVGDIAHRNCAISTVASDARATNDDALDG
jgi:hypothetical protein